jgi:hypothetical protein
MELQIEVPYREYNRLWRVHIENTRYNSNSKFKYK